jgi:hypothetical protein
MIIRNPKASMALLPALLTFAVPAFAGHPTNAIERHPTMSGIAAGAATHAALKARARYDKAHGRRLNFAERHPTLTGVAAGIFTHHEIKKHTPR